jgi:predicted MFS family arabinose efflux permease
LAPDNKPKLPSRQTARAILAYSSLGIQITVLVGGFAYLGKWLDDQYPMDKKWFTLGLVLFGVAVSIYYVIRQLAEMEKSKHK